MDILKAALAMSTCAAESELARLLYGQGRMEEAADLYRRCAGLAEALGAHEVAHRAHVGRAHVLRETGRFSEALEAAHRAQEVTSRAQDPSWEGSDATLQASIQHHLGNLDAAMCLYETALSTARKHGDLRNAAIVQANRALLLNHLGRYREAIVDFRLSLTLHRRVGNRESGARVMANLGSVYYDLRQFKAAKPWYLKALREYREMGDVQNEARALANLGNLAQEAGSLDAAEKLFEEALRALRHIGAQYDLAAALLNLANLLAKKGLPSQALQRYEEARELAGKVSEPRLMGAVGMNFGEFLLGTGHHEKARLLLGEALSHFLRLGDKNSLRKCQRLLRKAPAPGARH